METRIQIAYHFKIDPAQLVPGLIRLPEQIIRTISVGTEIAVTEKVTPDCLTAADRAALVAEVEKQTKEATRTAKPVGASATAPSADIPEGDDEEISAF